MHLHFNNEVTFVAKRWGITCISCLVNFPSLWQVQECKNQDQAHPNPNHLFPPTYLSPSLPLGPCGRPPYGSTDSIWLQLPKRGAQEHKNAAVYFYCSPFSFSSICLPYVYETLLDPWTHRPFIMRVASLNEIKNWNSPLSVTRGHSYFKICDSFGIQTRTNS